MKFLITMSPKDIMFTQPPDEVVKLMEETNVWQEKQMKEGVILEAYSVAGWNRYVSICQLNSAEDIDRLMRSHPGTRFMNYEAYPLSDMKETSKANMEVAKAAQARGVQGGWG